MLALAGMRIDPASNGPFQTSFNRGITLVKRDDLTKNDDSNVRIPLPSDVKITRLNWSHNSKYFSFAVVTDKGQQLWVAAVDDPTPRLLTDRLNTIMAGPRWLPNGKQMLCLLVPEKQLILSPL